MSNGLVEQKFAFFFSSLFSMGSLRQFFLLGKCFLPCRDWESNSFGHVVPLSSIPTLSPPWAGGSRKDVWGGRSVLIHLDQSLQNLSFQSHDSSYYQWKLGNGSAGCPSLCSGHNTTLFEKFLDRSQLLWDGTFTPHNKGTHSSYPIASVGGVYLCIYFYIRACARRGPRKISLVFFGHFPVYLLRQGFSLNIALLILLTDS